MRTIAIKRGGAPTFGRAAPTHAHALLRIPAIRRILQGAHVQAKLTIGAVNDPAEREADRVVDQVMRMPDRDASANEASGLPPTFAGAPHTLRRQRAACAAEQDEPLRRRADGGANPLAAAPDIVHQVLHSPAQPLDAASRSFFEPRFGYDFANVRVHTGEQAARFAHAVNAQAYTVGRDLVFGDGGFNPGSSAGRELLAHELTHVVQQGGGSHDTAPAVPHVQRLVRTTSVNCPAAATGIANPHTGSADRRASALLGTAITRIANAQASRVASPADADVVDVGNALRTVFHLDPADAATWTTPAPQARLPVILRRLQAAKDYIDSVVFTVTCIPNGGAGHTIAGCNNSACAGGIEAFSCHANPVEIVLCPDFWARGTDQRGRVWMHEVMHITFQIINDWGQPNVHNAHCYAQFVALLNGFNSPAGFRCH